MRTKRAFRPRRRLLITAGTAGLLIAIAVTAAGCTSSESGSGLSAASSAAVGGPARAPEASASAANGFAAAGGSSAASQAGSGVTAKFAPTSQQLIYTAQLSVRAANVAAAVSHATSIVSAAGGYVSDEDSHSGGGQPSQATATVTLKIPAAVYPATLAALTGTALGTQLSLSQQAQDVTQQVADVSSRVASDRAAIAQLRALLAHAGSVSSLLSVQNQINSEETDLESMLAQQSALNHETAYATVTLTIVGPKAVPAPKKAAPPPGLVRGLAGGWHAFRLTITWLLAILGAIAPFAAVVAVIGGVVVVARRRWRAGGAPPAS